MSTTHSYVAEGTGRGLQNPLRWFESNRNVDEFLIVSNR